MNVAAREKTHVRWLSQNSYGLLRRCWKGPGFVIGLTRMWAEMQKKGEGEVTVDGETMTKYDQWIRHNSKKNRDYERFNAQGQGAYLGRWCERLMRGE